MMDTTRRRFLCAGGMTLSGLALVRAACGQLPRQQTDAAFVARKGNIRHSAMGWCFKPLTPLALARHAKKLGLTGIEGIPRSAYKGAISLGLEISLVSGAHGFKQGPCNPKYVDKVVAGLSNAIEMAATIGAKKVITFTGMRYPGMDDEKAATRCVNAWKRVMPIAERKKVTVVLEHLNSRDASHPMKGHPGYFGDDVDFCIDLIRRVGSPRMKLLFDVYHVAIMNGDIIRRIRQYKDLIGHYHTAGNPGRGELDDTQEINYPAVMREIVKTGYRGFVAHEFIPTWADPVESLRHGVQVCDV